MQDILLKENRRHGDLLLPIKDYYMNIHGGTMLLDCHWHTELELFKILKGEFRFQIASSFFTVKEGDLLFINSGELHSAAADENTDAVYQAVVFSPDMLAGSAENRVFTEYLSPLLEGKLTVRRLFDASERAIQRDFDSILRLLNEKPKAYEIFVESFLYSIFGRLIETAEKYFADEVGRKESQTVQSIKQSIVYMQQNYANKITVAELARLCSMSEGNFSRTFHHYTLKSPICYLNRMRLLRAAQMLETTDKKVLDVALDCGFGSLSYFINVFRDAMGCTPSEYRRSGGEPML